MHVILNFYSVLINTGRVVVIVLKKWKTLMRRDAGFWRILLV